MRASSDYQPIGRMARPDEVAHLILYLCSDEAAFVTGSAYHIDGGLISCSSAITQNPKARSRL